MNVGFAPVVSVSLAGLVLKPGAAWGSDAKSALTWACASGAGMVQLDATMSGLRPRELDASARRDVRAMARRAGVGISGVDLFVPVQHFAEAAHVDRALGAMMAALELARDLADDGRAVVATELPAKLDEGTLATLRGMAQAAGVMIADCGWPARVMTDVGTADVGVGIDPAMMLASGADVLGEVARLRGAPAQARLSDLSGVGRVEVGTGRLDVMAYCVTLATKGYRGAMVIDLRGVRDQAGVVSKTVARLRAVV
jgi:sugar phosphate isomerase/epimerase